MWNTHSQSVEHALTDKPQSVQHTVNWSGVTVHASGTTAHNLTTIEIDQPKSVQHTGSQSVHPCMQVDWPAIIWPTKEWPTRERKAAKTLLEQSGQQLQHGATPAGAILSRAPAD